MPSRFSLASFTLFLISVLAVRTSHSSIESSLSARTFVIAVIDTGVDVQHRNLRENVWLNPGESGFDSEGIMKSQNGRDDDNNGFIDDSHGWNFANGTEDVDDEDGHGTHVAGLIQQTLREKVGPASFQLMPLKYAGPKTTAPESVRAFVAALRYAIAMKVDVINISGGGFHYNSVEYGLLQEAARHNIQVVAAAGNKAPHGQDRAFYPAAYNLPNIISVVATDKIGRVLPTSNLNHGKKNIFSLGEHLLSALPRDKFGYKSGSSQAAAIAAGLLAAKLISPVISPVAMTATNLHNP